MNKNLVFMISMIAVSLLLFLLRVTGLTAHIIVSLLGLVIMIPYTLKTKGEWTKAPLEILMRVMYLIAIVTGGALMKVHGVAALGIAHKISAAVFVVLLLVLYLPKWKK
jgi:hypothetical protein